MFQIGAHVKFDATNAEGETKVILGQVEKEYSEEAVLLCYEKKSDGLMSMKRTRIELDRLSLAKIRLGSLCSYSGRVVKVVRYSRKKTKSGLAAYYCEDMLNKRIYLLPEDKIIAAYEDARISPQDSFKKAIFSEENLWCARESICKFESNSSLIPEGFNTVLGNKIDLYEHQLETVRTILSKKPYRAMLADEVGLGKSIESLVVLSYAIKTEQCKKALIVVPDQLVFQWNLEAKSKFSLDVEIFYLSSFIHKMRKSPITIIGFGDFKRYYIDFIEDAGWDFIIADEAHKVLRDKSLYNGIFKLSKKTDYFLMLSATPILQRQNEYFKLLRLMYPQFYTKMGYDRFAEIMELRLQIKDDVEYMRNNISHFFEYELFDDYFERIKKIAGIIDDDFINEIIKKIENTDADRYMTVSLALKYLEISFELDQKFIRHRRNEILDPSSKRVLEEKIGFRAVNSTEGFRERDLINYALDELDESLSADKVDVDMAIMLCNSLFSSASALHSYISKNDLEDAFPNTYKMICQSSLIEKSVHVNSRILQLKEYLRKIVAKKEKVIVFSDFIESVKLIEQSLVEEFGDERVVKFSNELSSAEMQIVANRFQHNKDCLILVCDKSGGEGRNFQYAEYIIHFDMPWSPADLEQRIGRLDRIGRRPNHTVKNVVLYYEDTIESDLYEIYSNCLNIFEDSLCGIEIVFDDMNQIIHEYVKNGVRVGLEGLSDPLRELKEITENQISNEMISLMIQQSEDGYHSLEEDLVGKFDERNVGIFENAITEWIRGNDLGSVVYCSDPYRKVTINENTEKANKYEGTFYVKDALEYEDAQLFSCEHPFIRKVVDNARNSLGNKASAFSISNTGISWAGFVAIWELELYLPDLFDLPWSEELSTLKNEFIMQNRICVPVAMEGYQAMDGDTIMNAVHSASMSQVKKLCMSDISEILNGSDVLTDVSVAVKTSYQEYLRIQKSMFAVGVLDNEIEKLEFECLLENQINFVNKYDDKKLKFYKALKRSFERPAGFLDAVAFIELREKL